MDLRFRPLLNYTQQHYSPDRLSTTSRLCLSLLLTYSRSMVQNIVHRNSMRAVWNISVSVSIRT